MPPVPKNKVQNYAHVSGTAIRANQRDHFYSLDFLSVIMNQVVVVSKLVISRSSALHFVELNNGDVHVSLFITNNIHFVLFCF